MVWHIPSPLKKPCMSSKDRRVATPSREGALRGRPTSRFAALAEGGIDAPMGEMDPGRRVPRGLHGVRGVGPAAWRTGPAVDRFVHQGQTGSEETARTAHQDAG